jgi:formate-dependent phosphoribosylglycinamide formyltransferase (GAR transformylase)
VKRTSESAATAAKAGATKLASNQFERMARRLDAAAAPYRHANEMSWFLSGMERIRLPVAAKNALSTAGAATKIVGSPTPPQNPPDGITIDSTFGISLMRNE